VLVRLLRRKLQDVELQNSILHRARVRARSRARVAPLGRVAARLDELVESGQAAQVRHQDDLDPPVRCLALGVSFGFTGLWSP
jgi:hypothetical protein